MSEPSSTRVLVSVGDQVIIRNNVPHTILATVINVEHLGGFSVEWYGGINPFVPGLTGHWFARFNADGSNYFPWHPFHFVEKEVR